MRTTVAVLFALTVTVAVAAPVPKAAKKRPDAEVFVGSWETAVSETNGQPWSKAVWTFDEKLKMSSVQTESGGGKSEWQIKIDPTKTPKEIEISSGGPGDANALVYKGIYEIDGEDIRISYATGSDRPTTFDPKPGVFYTVLRRVKGEGK